MKDLPDATAYNSIGDIYTLNMQLSVMRKIIDALKATQQSDESLLKQALGALERSKVELRGITPTQDIDETITALRGRLGEKA